jgi:hypothetical protein
MIEPKIQIGDHVLTHAQAMALRVAVASFQMECTSDEGKSDLGPIADAYAARLEEIIAIIMRETR